MPELLTGVEPQHPAELGGDRHARAPARPACSRSRAAAEQWRVRVAAALHGREAVASQVTALALWELIPHPAGPVHITVDPPQERSGSREWSCTAAADAYAERRRVGGLPVSSVERAVVDAWGTPAALGAGATSGAAAITAVRRRLCRAARAAVELARSAVLSGRAELAPLVRAARGRLPERTGDLGLHARPAAPGMPVIRAAAPVAVGAETFVLDAACEESMLAVEMDGAAVGTARGPSGRPTSGVTPCWRRWLADPAVQLARMTRVARGVPAGHRGRARRAGSACCGADAGR